MYQVGERVKVNLKYLDGREALSTVSVILAKRRDPVLLRSEYQVQLNPLQTGWVGPESLEREACNASEA